MTALIQFLNKPTVIALFVLVTCLLVLRMTATSFLADMSRDRDEMVASLRQAQTPESQIAAISRGFDRIASEVNGMATSFFAFTSIVLVCAFAVRHRDGRHPSRLTTRSSEQRLAVRLVPSSTLDLASLCR